ncbi:hypothetical protein SAMN05216480_10358 [Pustulibacterium marinum]|uniref:DUF4271 domain-containing protein n=1 Tax=Pustulibacterium marinum TaxID=1224947 RepID=A0A1I7G1J2_9FLAO|nr:hypothetical protein [Pustulibacterium marinum]SFU42267.1 hypothetical protein SAMN05216480_10358 [Pustulibacterium marinum]
MELLPFLAIFGAMLLSRKLYNSKLLLLEADQKALLVELFARGSATYWVYGFLIVSIVLIMLNLEYQLVASSLVWIVYFTLAVVFMLFSTYRSISKLKHHAFPNFFVKNYMWVTAIRVGGLLLFILLTYLS